MAVLHRLLNELVHISQAKHAERHSDPRSHLAEWSAWMKDRQWHVRENQGKRTIRHFDEIGRLLDMYKDDRFPPFPPHLIP